MIHVPDYPAPRTPVRFWRDPDPTIRWPIEQVYVLERDWPADFPLEPLADDGGYDAPFDPGRHAGAVWLTGLEFGPDNGLPQRFRYDPEIHGREAVPLPAVLRMVGRVLGHDDLELPPEPKARFHALHRWLRQRMEDYP